MNNAKLQLKKCYLDTIKIVMNHSVQEDLLLTFGALFKKIASDLNANITMNQVGELTPPEMPRVSILSKDMFLNFGLNRIEIGIKGSRKHVKNEDLFLIYKHRLSEVELLLQDYISKTEIKENFMGIVAPLRYPQSLDLSKDDLIKELHKMLVGKNNAKIATFTFKIGLKNNNTYENYEVSDYEVKNVRVQPSLTTHSIVNLDKFPTVERGVLIIIDVNNKLQLNYKLSQDYPNLIKNFFNAVYTLGKIFR